MWPRTNVLKSGIFEPRCLLDGGDEGAPALSLRRQDAPAFGRQLVEAAGGALLSQWQWMLMSPPVLNPVHSIFRGLQCRSSS
jgi:hypothetical protein